MNIGYRIVNGILALAVFPAFIFLQLVYMKVSPGFIDYGMDIEINLKRLVDLMGGTDSLSEKLSGDGLSGVWNALTPARGKVIAMLFFIGIALLAALFIVVVSFITSKKPVYIVGAGIGFVSTIVFKIIFSSIAKMFISGEINVIDMISDGIIGSLIGMIINVDAMRIGTFANAFIILFACLLLWTGIYYVTDVGLEDKKAPATAPKKKKK